MAFDPDAYIASFDPDAYLAAAGKPKPASASSMLGPGSVDPDPPSEPIKGTYSAPFVTDPEAMQLQAENAGIKNFGVTGQHGETGDPLARDINATILMNPMMKLLGYGVKAGANKLLSTEAGKLGEIAAKGTRAPSAEALEAATAEAGSMNRGAMADMLELQAQAEEAAAVKAAQEATSFAMPSISPFHPFKSMAAVGRAAAEPMAARLAPVARKVVDSQAPLATPSAALLMSLYGR